MFRLQTWHHWSFLLAVAAGAYLTTATQASQPAAPKAVRAVVEGPGVKLNNNILASILVGVVGEHELFKKGGKADLQITKKTKIMRQAGDKTEPARLEDLKKGITILFSDFKDVAKSSPAIISPGVIVILEPKK